jgi:hypothetical protein
MTNRYDIGNVLKFTADFYVGTTLTDPTTIVFKVLLPDRTTIVTYTYGTDGNVTKLATGKYQCLYTPSVPGNYTWNAVGTGTCVAQDNRDFNVIGSPIP